MTVGDMKQLGLDYSPMFKDVIHTFAPGMSKFTAALLQGNYKNNDYDPTAEYDAVVVEKGKKGDLSQFKSVYINGEGISQTAGVESMYKSLGDSQVEQVLTVKTSKGNVSAMSKLMKFALRVPGQARITRMFTTL